MLIYCIPKFSTTYKNSYRLHLLPWTLPLAHISLMGSVYCTVAITIERFITVCYPFTAHRQVFSTASFIIPIIFLTTIYNIPKFFELNIVDKCMLKNISCPQDTERLTVRPTPLRQHHTYVRVYILWSNLIFYIIIPFLLLIILNIKVYQGCRTFENTFTENIRVCFSSITSKRKSSHSLDEETKDISTNVDHVESESNTVSSVKDIRKTKYYHSIASQRHREVILAKISIYITFVFLLCHSVRLIPNSYEMYITYVKDSKKSRPFWFAEVSGVSHLLLTFASSANFFIYYFKYGFKHSNRG
nr:uncharacterized protein LOC121118465 [Lepeophtheirus salmonis]